MDKRNFILEKLKSYKGIDSHEEAMRLEVISFIEANEDCFERSLKIGHVNGGAWIVDESFKYTLLTHHAKLDKWFQLGGHSDGNWNTLEVALREGQEESGLESIRPLNVRIFDIDIHTIPARGEEAEHNHYEIRFIFVADKNESLIKSNESKDLSWIEVERVEELNSEEAMKRMVNKTKNLKI
ncbi:MAG: NUDIX hydrolase [Candidatus Dojkabacteria bacterium]